MKSREEIYTAFEAGERNGVLDAVAPELQLEVLLDIRELLQGLNPPTMMLRQVEVNADDKGLHSQD